MLRTLPKNTRSPKYKVRVVDIDGNEEIFDCAADAAKALNASRACIYVAISTRSKIRGCRCYKVEEQ